MKPEQREKLRKEAADQQAQSVNAPKPPLTPDTLSKVKPTHQLRVAVGRADQSEQDALATKGLIEAYQTKDGFKCPRCPATFTNPDAFIEHLAEEINKSLANLKR